jgi:hypothetical protein
MSTRLCLIRDFVQLAKGGDVTSGEGNPNRENPHSYTKMKFHRLGKQVLKAIAEEMGLQSGSYDIRSNLGGVAVSGEITLHGESIYIQFSLGGSDLEVLYRSCNGRKDYTGGANHWMRWDDLCDLPQACKKFKGLVDGGCHYSHR